MKPDCVQFLMWTLGVIDLPPDIEDELEQYFEQQKGNL